MRKLLYIIGFLASVTLALGTLFKLLHWPSAMLLIDIGFFTLLLLFFPATAIRAYRASTTKGLPEKLKNIFGGTASVIIGISGFFKVMHLQGANVLLMAGAFLFVFGFLPFLFFSLFKESASSGNVR